jgi:hypothetical protein
LGHCRPEPPNLIFRSFRDFIFGGAIGTGFV